MRVGVIGGGQLARMMIGPAVELGIDLRVLAEAEGSSAGLAASAVGDHRDREAVIAFADSVDVVTFDHEHVPQELLRELVARGVAVHPGPDALLYAQDKLLMRARLAELGLPVPDWAAVACVRELDGFLAEHGGRAVVKTPRGGYDGKGVRVVSAGSEVAGWFDDDQPLLVEELVEFRRELSQVLARTPSGEIALWPVVESVQVDGVCSEVIAPAPHSPGRIADVAADVATAIAENLGVTGVLAVELFETTDDRLLVNELAMRPHNSGHWSTDGSTTSQFEQHLRAVLDLPLGATGCRDPWSVMVNVFGGARASDPRSRISDLGSRQARLPKLDHRIAQAMADQPDVKLHFYGKEPRPGRKIGHVTAVGDDLDEVVFRARAAAAFFED